MELAAYLAVDEAIAQLSEESEELGGGVELGGCLQPGPVERRRLLLLLVLQYR